MPATAYNFRNALERMPHINHAEVCRESNDAHNNSYVWIVTFKSNMSPQPAFLVDTSNLVGTNPLGFTLTRTVHGGPPDDYDFTIVQGTTTTSFDVKHLLTGKLYYL